MRIGVIGGSGPAGSALGARLASVGYEVVIGSRSKYRAMETRDEIVAAHPELESLLEYGENAVAADCDLVVIATPWDSAATMAQQLAPHLEGKIVVSMANALVRVGREFEPLIPPRGSVALQACGRLFRPRAEEHRSAKRAPRVLRRSGGAAMRLEARGRSGPPPFSYVPCQAPRRRSPSSPQTPARVSVR